MVLGVRGAAGITVCFFIAGAIGYVMRMIRELSNVDEDAERILQDLKLKRRREELEEVLGVRFFGGVASHGNFEFLQKEMLVMQKEVEELATTLKGIRSSLEREVNTDDQLDVLDARLQLLERTNKTTNKKDKK